MMTMTARSQLDTARSSVSDQGKVIQSKGRWSIFDGRMSLTESTAGRVSMIDHFRQQSPLLEQSESDMASECSSSIMSSSVNLAGTNTVPHTAQGLAAASAGGTLLTLGQLHKVYSSTDIFLVEQRYSIHFNVTFIPYSFCKIVQ